jgi:hypothetical protein
MVYLGMRSSRFSHNRWRFFTPSKKRTVGSVYRFELEPVAFDSAFLTLSLLLNEVGDQVFQSDSRISSLAIDQPPNTEGVFIFQF